MENLKKLRLQENLSQQKLAEKFGITQQAIYNYENGITEPDIYMLKKMADFFHTSIDYIVGYSENSLPHEVAEFTQNQQDLYVLYALYEQLPGQIKNNIISLIKEIVKLQS